MNNAPPCGTCQAIVGCEDARGGGIVGCKAYRPREYGSPKGEAYGPIPVRHIEVMQVGSPVLIGEDIPAIVTGISIREQCHITYEVSWWDGRTHNCKWLDAIEVRRTDGTQGIKIGFRPTA